jgi:hypothetical protein
MVDPLLRVAEGMVPHEEQADPALKVEARRAPPIRVQDVLAQGVVERAARPTRGPVDRVVAAGGKVVEAFGRESLRQAGSPAVQILPNRVGRRKGFWG